MEKFSSFLFASLISVSSAVAQTRDLVVFSDDGAKFTLIVDGDVKNAQPAARVVAPGIRNETPLCLVRFEDKSLPDVKQNMWLEAGKEYTVLVTTNKKGVRVMRPQGEAPLGTAASAEPVKPKPDTFVEDAPTSPASTTVRTTGVDQTVGAGGVQQTTTVTVVEEDGMDGGSENVNFSMGVNGVGINMNVGITESGTGASSTTTTRTTTTRTTTTTSSSASTDEPVAVAPTRVAEPYRMPGYTGPIGCAMPMSSSEFTNVKGSISSKSFEDSKMTIAKQTARDRCFSVEQVKGIMGLFSFEESKLEFAKFAYDHTHDIGNYFMVNDAFTFETSIDDLNEYIRSR